MPLIKPERGQPIYIEIGGEKLELRFSLGILKELEREHGIQIIKGQTVAEILVSPDKQSIALYFGLKEKQPHITQAWIDEHMDASQQLDVLPMLTYAMTGVWSRPASGDNTEQPQNFQQPPAPVKPNGLISGPSDVTTSDLANAKSGR
jgi:hypothetical protein